MKKLVLVLLICAAFCLSGCSLVYTAPERNMRLAHGADRQFRAAVDDADYILLTERASWCTEYHCDSAYTTDPD